MRTTFPALLSSLFVSAIAAQTFVVDGANGPGTDFTTIDAAVGTVPSGSTLLIRPGTYLGLSIWGKGLTVLADPGVDVLVGISVLETTASQPVVIEGMRTRIGVQITNCLGSVTLRDIAPATAPATATNRLQAISCRQLLFDRCRFTGSGVAAATLSNCEHASMIDTSVISSVGDGLQFFYDGDLDLVGCELRGGVAVAPYTGFGMKMNAYSRARLLGGTEVYAGTASPGTNPTQKAIGNQGTVRSAASTTIVGPVAAGVTLTATPECALRVAGGALGSTVTAELVGASGALDVLMFGPVGPPVSVPGFQDTFWLDPAGVVFVAAGVPTFALTASIAVPANGQLIGQTLGWQGLTWQPVDGFTVSNPAAFTIRS